MFAVTSANNLIPLPLNARLRGALRTSCQVNKGDIRWHSSAQIYNDCLNLSDQNTIFEIDAAFFIINTTIFFHLRMTLYGRHIEYLSKHDCYRVTGEDVRILKIPQHTLNLIFGQSLKNRDKVL
uniref:Uncharacterized protein n=1 Tax=Pararge aegeria TaxID=116150 RepID=S4P4V5_9NEOP